MRRTAEDQALEAIFNFAAEPRDVAPEAGEPEMLFSSDDPRYGGGGGVRLSLGRVTLPGRTAVLLRSRR